MTRRLLFPYGKSKFVDVRKEMMTREVSARKMTDADYEHLNRLLQKRRTASWNGISKVT